MKLKAALFLVFALTFQPIFAISNPYHQFQEGIKVVLPAVLGSTVLGMILAGNAVLHKLDRTHVTTLLSFVVLGSILVVKSMMTCPVKGTTGCTCGLK